MWRCALPFLALGLTACTQTEAPDKDAFATAKFLDGSPLDWKAGANAQAVFGEWATRAWSFSAALSRFTAVS